MKKKYGWKGFRIDENGNLHCKNKQYKLGEIAEQDGELEVCRNGIHFCWNCCDVYEYYNFNDADIVLGKVEILGDIVDEERKAVTNKLKIIKLYKTKEQLKKLTNNGSDNNGYFNTGDWNTGDWNTGDWNTGDWNTGNRNTGDWNTGNRNTGDWNTGNRNTGNSNTGNSNTGNRNTGNSNTGNWNSCNYSNGLFNTISPKINLFNKPSEYTMEEFKSTKWYDALTNGNFELTKWVEYTEEEKKQDKAKEMTGGKTVAIPYNEACQNWWKSLSEDDREIIQTMPNFDKDIFKEITGIKI